jgi:hypothetical protein
MVTDSLLERSKTINNLSAPIFRDNYIINKYIHIAKNGQLIFDNDCALSFNAHTHLCRANWKPITSDIKSFLQLISITEIAGYKSIIT